MKCYTNKQSIRKYRWYLHITEHHMRKSERCLTRLTIGLSKLTYGHYMSWEECGENTPLTIKHILTECPSLNRRLQFFDSNNKTME